MGGMWVLENGICGLIEVVAPQLACPEGYELSRTDGGLEDLGLAEAAVLLQCLEVGGGEGAADPDVVCPDGFDGEVLKISQYVWRDKSNVRCVKVNEIEGRIWCPPNFIPYGSLYVEKIVAAAAEDGLADDAHRRLADDAGAEGGPTPYDIWQDYPELVTGDAFLFTLPSYLLTDFDNPSGCGQVVAVDAVHCSEFECQTPFIKEQKRIIENWTTAKLGYLDTDTFVFDAIPTGNDLRFTTGAHDLENRQTGSPH